MRRGFTLIELLVVISIIGILATLVVANYNSARLRARDVERKSDLNQMKKSLRLYYNDLNLYPETGTGDKIKACDNPATTTFDWGEQFICGTMVYMKVLPEDPKSTQSYSYSQAGSGQDLCLWATLENTADEDITETQSRCSDCSVGDDDYVVCAD